MYCDIACGNAVKYCQQLGLSEKLHRSTVFGKVAISLVYKDKKNNKLEHIT